MATAGDTDLKAALRPKAAPAVPARGGFFRWLESKVFSWLPAVSFAFMIYSSITAIYQSKGDPSTVAFIAGSLSILAGLYWCMREFERAVAQRQAEKRERLKLSIWLLAMALNTLFSYRVTSVIDSAVMSAIVWGIAAVTTVVGCYLMFFTPQTPDASAATGAAGQPEKVTLTEVKPVP